MLYLRTNPITNKHNLICQGDGQIKGTYISLTKAQKALQYLNLKCYLHEIRYKNWVKLRTLLPKTHSLHLDVSILDTFNFKENNATKI